MPHEQRRGLMAARPTFGDRVISVVVWALLAALPMVALKVLWDRQLISARLLDATLAPYAIGWALVFAVVLVFLAGNERLRRARDAHATRVQELTNLLAIRDREIAGFNRQLELREQAYRQKIEQLDAAIGQQVQRRLLLAQQADHAQWQERVQLLARREQRLQAMRDNEPLQRELQGLAARLAALQAQVQTDAGVRFIAPGEVPALVAGLTPRATERIVLGTRQVTAERLAWLDRILTEFWARGGALQLRLDHGPGARIDWPALLAWWRTRGAQVACRESALPLPRLLTIDRREAVVLTGDLLGDAAAVEWPDYAAHVMNIAVAAELDNWCDAQLLADPAATLRLVVAAGHWRAARDGGGLLTAAGMERTVIIDGGEQATAAAAFAARPADGAITMLLAEDRDGQYHYRAHAGDTPAAAESPAGPLPF